MTSFTGYCLATPAVNLYTWDDDTLEKYKSLKFENELMRRWGLIGQRIYNAKEHCETKKNSKFSKNWNKYVEPAEQSPESINHWLNLATDIEINSDNALRRYKKVLYEEYAKNHKKPLTDHGTLSCWTHAALSTSGSSAETLSDTQSETELLERVEPISDLNNSLLLEPQMIEIDVVPDIDDRENEKK